MLLGPRALGRGVRQGLLAAVLCSAHSAPAATRATPPNVLLQRARAPSDILRVCRDHANFIAPRPLAESLYRIAGGLKQPSQAEERAAIASGPDMMAVVSHLTRVDASAATSIVMLRALAMLGWRADAGEAHGVLELLASRACAIVDELSLPDVSALDWAARKLALPLPASIEPRLAALPFCVYSAPLPFKLEYADLEAELRPHLNRELILLRDSQGERLVPEARFTGWWSLADVPFKYSGKEMDPTIPNGGLLGRVRDSLFQLSGVSYDSCLINLYEHGKAGMRYHSDPDQGTLWSRDTHVVSFGCTRAFILRTAGEGGEGGEGMHYEYVLDHGDVVHMFGPCQQEYQHAVRVEKDESDAGPRISLVFKQSLAAR